ncbi:MAG: 30S ribosomal protein S9 [Planctomycetota bacterium]|nr:MAG: 30S ribosomal protein S9 [Planctomycetota bacterium]
MGSQAQSETQEARAPQAPTSGVYLGTGRRKSAIARVRIMPGDGKILINGRELPNYFPNIDEQLAVTAPLIATKTEKNFEVRVNVHGGGHRGQSDAIRLGVARALVQADSGFEPTLRDKGYLTRDSRVVERKKYGRRKARRRFQFSKR